MKKISVIMPVYNAERTLVNSISSILTQSLSDIEIILVDDCSKDKSWKILQDCAGQFGDKVIALQNEVNLGPGGARNLGIKAASGEYIGFVDSDDCIVSTMYEKMYAKAKETGADIVDCGFYNEKTDNAIIYTSDELTGNMNDKKRSELIVSGGYIWSKIFKAELLKDDENCRFREHAILEDADFLTYLYATVKNVANVKEILYKYSYLAESASNEVKADKYHKDITSAINAIYEKCHHLPNYDGIRMAVEYEMAQMYLYGLVNAKKADNNAMIAEMRSLRELIKIPFRENSYIINKISSEDLSFMEIFDKK